MDYQLVIKFWRKSLEDETLLPAIQSELKGVLGDAAELHGYNVSAKEINLFVVTPDPKHSFRASRLFWRAEASCKVFQRRLGW